LTMADAKTGMAAAGEANPRAPLAKKAATVVFSHVFAKENVNGRLEDFYDMPAKGQGVLGEGSYGKVCKARKKTTKAEYAVKEIMLKTKKDVDRFEVELDIHSQLDHGNIVKLYEVFKDIKKVHLIMEMCTGGELFDRIMAETEKHEGSAFGEKDCGTYMRQIMRAIVYMHKHGVAHRDIKPENFLLQHKGRDAEIKVIDFGLSKKFSLDPANKSEMKTKAGTPYYVAPQVLQGKYDESCDIWSCGVIMYILLCGYPPFYGDRDEDILRRVRKGAFDFPQEDWKNISNKGGAKELIKMMLTLDPAKRPDAPTCLAHPWFSGLFSDVATSLKPDFAQSLRKFRHTSRLKKIALTMVAQQLHEKEVRELKATFVTMDKDHDGTLTAAEIIEAMRQHGLEIPSDLAEAISKVDTDGSGIIEYSEFIAATLTKAQYYRENVLIDAFKQFDADGDGFLTVDELAQVLSSGSKSREVAEGMIREIDQNCDGKISFDEFKEMMGNENL